VNTLLKRRRRQTIELDETDGILYDPDREEIKVKVYSGLYVNEVDSFDEGPRVYPEEVVRLSMVIFFALIVFNYLQPARSFDPSRICFPQRDFAMAVALAGLILIVIAIIAFLCLIAKRRRRKDLSTTGSSIYSGPYSNTAYSHSS